MKHLPMGLVKLIKQRQTFISMRRFCFDLGWVVELFAERFGKSI
jgi:hypothetical protein